MKSATTPPLYAYCTFKTSLGWIAILLSDETVCRLSLAHATSEEALAGIRPYLPENAQRMTSGNSLSKRIGDYADGFPDNFSDIAVDTDYLTPLGRTVFQHCRRIPYGQTRSYGQLALEAGRSNAARAVGQFMASNRTPLIVPCHRVVASNGGLGGFSAPGGIALKEKLLMLEGSL